MGHVAAVEELRFCETFLLNGGHPLNTFHSFQPSWHACLLVKIITLVVEGREKERQARKEVSSTLHLSLVRAVAWFKATISHLSSYLVGPFVAKL